jgi:hypothetical protein
MNAIIVKTIIYGVERWENLWPIPHRKECLAFYKDSSLVPKYVAVFDFVLI